MITKRFGVRGVVLSLWGLPWVFYGIAVLISKNERFSRPGPGAALQFMDNPAWGWMWIVVGAYAIVSTILRKYSYKWFDEVAYGLLICPPVVWSASYLISWFEYTVSGGALGQRTAYLGFIIFTNFIIMVGYLTRHLREADAE